jgi:hypothetical protein
VTTLDEQCRDIAATGVARSLAARVTRPFDIDRSTVYDKPITVPPWLAATTKRA